MHVYRTQFLTDLFKDPFLSCVCVCPGSNSCARCSLGTSQRLYQRWRVSWADPIVKIRWKSKLRCFSNYHATGRCVRAVLREAAESSIAGSRPSRCPARLFAPFAFQQTSNKCCRRPRSLHCDSTLWKRRGGAFRPQGPTMARCHIPVWLLVPLLGCCQFSLHLSEKDIMVFPRPRLSQCVPAHGPEVVLKHDYQQRSASSEHSCGHRQGSCHFCSLQPAAWHQSAIRILRAPDPDATKFGPGSTERRGPSVPRQSVSQETPATLLYDMLRCKVKLGKRTLSEFRPDESTSTYNIHVLVSSDGQRRALRAKLLLWPNSSSCACGGRRQGLSLE